MDSKTVSHDEGDGKIPDSPESPDTSPIVSRASSPVPDEIPIEISDADIVIGGDVPDEIPIEISDADIVIEGDVAGTQRAPTPMPGPSQSCFSDAYDDEEEDEEEYDDNAEDGPWQITEPLCAGYTERLGAQSRGNSRRLKFLLAENLFCIVLSRYILAGGNLGEDGEDMAIFA